LELTFEWSNVEQNIKTGSENENSTNIERISEFIEDTLSILPQSNTKEGEEWRRRMASTAIAQFNGKNSVEIKYEICFSMKLMFRGHLQWQSDLDLRFISGENLGCEDQKVEHL
jgi:hypothetical protein